ncbi:Hypothetical Protein FCC1311_005492 [Hondaea fermentalgiana]|uniref:Uncharacterized protein n=1 Tax=Hondaea fermentalgiana TaxID=2315210 RepID=A0A2R5G8G0_9STRA|nr:Hypothetical Protein FCC1311_005492 [Hondaea fermentalgiana]|eukprot:GBG24331.1 Hypothetical Protein FCC1311_005492 [Hondaea fermentalgiana]
MAKWGGTRRGQLLRRGRREEDRGQTENAYRPSDFNAEEHREVDEVLAAQNARMSPIRRFGTFLAGLWPGSRWSSSNASSASMNETNDIPRSRSVLFGVRDNRSQGGARSGAGVTSTRDDDDTRADILEDADVGVHSIFATGRSHGPPPARDLEEVNDVSRDEHEGFANEQSFATAMETAHAYHARDHEAEEDEDGDEDEDDDEDEESHDDSGERNSSVFPSAQPYGDIDAADSDGWDEHESADDRSETDLLCQDDSKSERDDASRQTGGKSSVSRRLSGDSKNSSISGKLSAMLTTRINLSRPKRPSNIPEHDVESVRYDDGSEGSPISEDGEVLCSYYETDSDCEEGESEFTDSHVFNESADDIDIDDNDDGDVSEDDTLSVLSLIPATPPASHKTSDPLMRELSDALSKRRQLIIPKEERDSIENLTRDGKQVRGYAYLQQHRDRTGQEHGDDENTSCASSVASEVDSFADEIPESKSSSISNRVVEHACGDSSRGSVIPWTGVLPGRRASQARVRGHDARFTTAGVGTKRATSISCYEI